MPRCPLPVSQTKVTDETVAKSLPPESEVIEKSLQGILRKPHPGYVDALNHEPRKERKVSWKKTRRGDAIEERVVIGVNPEWTNPRFKSLPGKKAKLAIAAPSSESSPLLSSSGLSLQATIRIRMPDSTWPRPDPLKTSLSRSLEKRIQNLLK